MFAHSARCSTVTDAGRTSGSCFQLCRKQSLFLARWARHLRDPRLRDMIVNCTAYWRGIRFASVAYYVAHDPLRTVGQKSFLAHFVLRFFSKIRASPSAPCLSRALIRSRIGNLANSAGSMSSTRLLVGGVSGSCS